MKRVIAFVAAIVITGILAIGTVSMSVLELAGDEDMGGRYGVVSELTDSI